MKRFIQAESRAKSSLLPESLDGYVADNWSSDFVHLGERLASWLFVEV